MTTPEGSSLLHLLQLSDSTFPIGGFAHSLGLESLCQEGMLRGGRSAVEMEDGLERLLRARLAIEVTRTDLPLVMRAHALAVTGAMAGIKELDALADAVKPIWEWRDAGARMGRRLLEAVSLFGSTPLLAGLISERARGPQLPVAFGVAAQQLGCARTPTAQAYAANYCSGQLGAGVRLGLLGQRAMQRIMHGLKGDILIAVERAEQISIDEIGGGLPLAEIAGMRHRYAHERLFTS